MATISQLIVDIQTNTAQFSADMGKAVRIAEQAGARIERIGSTLKNGLLGLAAGFAAKEIFDNAAEAEGALKQLEATLRSTGGAAGLSSDELQKMASAIEDNSTFGDDAVIKMQSVLLTFTRIGKDVVPAATQAIADLSVKLGQDLQSSAIQVGKALNDPVKGITALQRVGVSFTESQKALIKSLVESGKVAEAQQIILKELQTEFGGAAAAARDTLGGALTALHEKFGDLLETIGLSQSGGLRLAIETLIVVVKDLSSGFSKIRPVLEGVIAAASTFVAIQLAVKIREIAVAVGALNLALLANPWGVAVAGAALLVGSLVACRDVTVQLGDTTTTVGKIASDVFARLVNIIGGFGNATIAVFKTIGDVANEVFTAIATKDFSHMHSAWELFSINAGQDFIGGFLKPVVGAMEEAKKKMDELSAMAEKFKGNRPSIDDGGGGTQKKTKRSRLPADYFVKDPEYMADIVNQRGVKEALEHRLVLGKKLLDQLEKQVEVEKKEKEAIDAQYAVIDKITGRLKDENQELRLKIEGKGKLIPLLQMEDELMRSVSIDRLPAALEETRKLYEQNQLLTLQYDAQHRAISAVLDSHDSMSKKVEKIVELFSTGKITMEEYAEALDKLRDKQNAVSDAGKQMGSEIVTAFDQAIFQGQKFGDVLHGLLGAILRIAEQKIILDPLTNLIGGGLGKVGSLVSGGGGLGGVLGKIGGFFSALGIFGEGGSVRANQPAIVGDTGMELFVPDRGGRIYAPGQYSLGGGSGGSAVQINVINNGNSSARTEERSGPNGLKIVDVIIEEVDNRIRSGKSTARAIQQTFGLQRQGVVR